MNKPTLTRRSLLSTLGLGGAAYFLGHGFSPRLASAEDDAELPLLVMAYFEGGWDTLLSLDPRNEQEFGTGKAGIETQYGLLAQNDPELAQALAETGNTGIYQPSGSNITFGPTMGALAPYFEDLCVVRGINMGTLTHEVGRRYFRTGKVPRGLQASGSDLATWFVQEHADERVLANLVVANETYNQGLDPAATGVNIRSSQDLFYLMNQVEAPLGAETVAAIDAYLDEARCLDARLDSSGMVTTFHTSRGKAAELGSGELWKHFDFESSSPSQEIIELAEAFGVLEQPPAAYPVYDQAMVAAQALKHGISQAVSISLGFNLDDHDDSYQTDHSSSLRFGFDAAAKLIAFLKDPNNGTGGKALWERTVFVLWSEFARTPMINPRGGRDHHLASACLVGGKGIRGNRVIGATDDESYAFRPVDLETGEPDDGGVLLTPADVHATVLEAAGLSYDHISNQDPELVAAMLKG